MTVQLIVFDLDGTLIDTMGDYARKAAELISLNYPMDVSEATHQYFRTSGYPVRTQLEQLFPKHARNDDVSRHFEDWKTHYLKNGFHPPVETLSLLRQLKAMGYTLAISSNNMQSHVSKLSRNWPMDAALGYKSSNFCKGSHHFDWLENHLGIPCSKILFVGDSPNDARIGISCGVKFIGLITRHFEAGDFLSVSPDLRTISSLNDLVGSLS